MLPFGSLFMFLKGGKSVHSFPSFKNKRGGKVLPCPEGGMHTVSDPRFSHFVDPHPGINNKSHNSDIFYFYNYQN